MNWSRKPTRRKRTICSTSQPEWGTPVEKRVDQAIGIELQNLTGDTDIDIWIDDIAMY